MIDWKDILTDKKLIAFVVIILFLFTLIAVVSLTSGNKTGSKLILHCTKTNEDNKSNVQDLKIYNYSDHKEVVQEITLDMSGVEEEQYEKVKSLMKEVLETKLSSQNIDSKDFKVSIDIKNKELVAKIEYQVTKENELAMYSVFSINLNGMSKEDMKNYFSEDGYVCEK